MKRLAVCGWYSWFFRPPQKLAELGAYGSSLPETATMLDRPGRLTGTKFVFHRELDSTTMGPRGLRAVQWIVETGRYVLAFRVCRRANIGRAIRPRTVEQMHVRVDDGNAVDGVAELFRALRPPGSGDVRGRQDCGLRRALSVVRGLAQGAATAVAATA